MYWPGQIHPPPSCFFCYEWATSTTFHHMWTNGEAQINQLSASLDVYGFLNTLLCDRTKIKLVM